MLECVHFGVYVVFTLNLSNGKAMAFPSADRGRICQLPTDSVALVIAPAAWTCRRRFSLVCRIRLRQ